MKFRRQKTSLSKYKGIAKFGGKDEIRLKWYARSQSITDKFRKEMSKRDVPVVKMRGFRRKRNPGSKNQLSR